MVTTIHSWQTFRITKWVLKFDNKEQNWEKIYQIRGDYSQIERGEQTGSAGSCPYTPVCCLWAFTQGRLQERTKQPGHVYFDRFNLHSFHRGGSLGFWAVAGESSRCGRLRALSLCYQNKGTNILKRDLRKINILYE